MALHHSLAHDCAATKIAGAGAPSALLVECRHANAMMTAARRAITGGRRLSRQFVLVEPSTSPASIYGRRGPNRF